MVKFDQKNTIITYKKKEPAIADSGDHLVLNFWKQKIINERPYQPSNSYR